MAVETAYSIFVQIALDLSKSWVLVACFEEHFKSVDRHFNQSLTYTHSYCKRKAFVFIIKLNKYC